MIEIVNITKAFGNKKVLNNLSYVFEKGKSYCIIGANGAGKSTLLYVLASVLKVDSGDLLFKGISYKNKGLLIRKKLGFVFQECLLDDDLSVETNLELHALLFHSNKKFRMKQINSVLKIVNLLGERKTLVKNLSGGMKKRLELARGLLNNPEVIFLDEPTLGLDVSCKRSVWKYIKSLKNKTIIVSSNDLDEARFLCDEILLLDKGNFKKKFFPKNFSSVKLEKSVLEVLRK